MTKYSIYPYRVRQVGRKDYQVIDQHGILLATSFKTRDEAISYAKEIKQKEPEWQQILSQISFT